MKTFYKILAYLYSFCKFFEILPRIIIVRERAEILCREQVLDMGLLVDQVDLRRAETAALFVGDVAGVTAFGALVDGGQVVRRKTVRAQQGVRS